MFTVLIVRSQTSSAYLKKSTGLLSEKTMVMKYLIMIFIAVLILKSQIIFGGLKTHFMDAKNNPLFIMAFIIGFVIIAGSLGVFVVMAMDIYNDGQKIDSTMHTMMEQDFENNEKLEKAGRMNSTDNLGRRVNKNERDLEMVNATADQHSGKLGALQQRQTNAEIEARDLKEQFNNFRGSQDSFNLAVDMAVKKNSEDNKNLAEELAEKTSGIRTDLNEGFLQVDQKINAKHIETQENLLNMNNQISSGLASMAEDLDTRIESMKQYSNDEDSKLRTEFSEGDALLREQMEQMKTEMSNIQAAIETQNQITTADIQANATRIDGNQAAIQANATRIDGNQTAIQGNATRIDGNQTAIQGNATRIDGNQTAIQGNATRIDGNQAAIQGNATGIDGNQAAIQANATRIDGNQTAIQGNATRIDGNQTAIQGNATRIDGNQAAIQGNEARIDALEEGGGEEQYPLSHHFLEEIDVLSEVEERCPKIYPTVPDFYLISQSSNEAKNHASIVLKSIEGFLGYHISNSDKNFVQLFDYVMNIILWKFTDNYQRKDNPPEPNGNLYDLDLSTISGHLIQCRDYSGDDPNMREFCTIVMSLIRGIGDCNPSSHYGNIASPLLFNFEDTINWRKTAADYFPTTSHMLTEISDMQYQIARSVTAEDRYIMINKLNVMIFNVQASLRFFNMYLTSMRRIAELLLKLTRMKIYNSIDFEKYPYALVVYNKFNSIKNNLDIFRVTKEGGESRYMENNETPIVLSLVGGTMPLGNPSDPVSEVIWRIPQNGFSSNTASPFVHAFTRMAYLEKLLQTARDKITESLMA
jgi:predicted thioesterase